MTVKLPDRWKKILELLDPEKLDYSSYRKLIESLERLKNQIIDLLLELEKFETFDINKIRLELLKEYNFPKPEEFEIIFRPLTKLDQIAWGFKNLLKEWEVKDYNFDIEVLVENKVNIPSLLDIFMSGFTIFEAFIDSLPDAINSVFKGIFEVLKTIYGFAKTVLESVFNLFKDLVIKFANLFDSVIGENFIRHYAGVNGITNYASFHVWVGIKIAEREKSKDILIYSLKELIDDEIAHTHSTLRDRLEAWLEDLKGKREWKLTKILERYGDMLVNEGLANEDNKLEVALYRICGGIATAIRMLYYARDELIDIIKHDFDEKPELIDETKRWYVDTHHSLSYVLKLIADNKVDRGVLDFIDYVIALVGRGLHFVKSGIEGFWDWLKDFSRKIFLRDDESLYFVSVEFYKRKLVQIGTGVEFLIKYFEYLWFRKIVEIGEGIEIPPFIRLIIWKQYIASIGWPKWDVYGENTISEMLSFPIETKTIDWVGSFLNLILGHPAWVDTSNLIVTLSETLKYPSRIDSSNVNISSLNLILGHPAWVDTAFYNAYISDVKGIPIFLKGEDKGIASLNLIVGHPALVSTSNYNLSTISNTSLIPISTTSKTQYGYISTIVGHPAIIESKTSLSTINIAKEMQFFIESKGFGQVFINILLQIYVDVRTTNESIAVISSLESRFTLDTSNYNITTINHMRDNPVFLESYSYLASISDMQTLQEPI